MIDSTYTGAIGGAASGASTGFALGGPWGAAIGGVVGGIGGILSGGGEDDARKAAEEQAKMIEMQAREEQRRKLLQINNQLGLTKATIYANDVQLSGSAKRYRDSMESEYRRQLAYDRFVTKKQVEYTLEGGEAAAGAIRRAGIGSMISSFGQAGAAFGGFGGGTADLSAVNTSATNKAGGFYGTGLP